MLASSAVFLYFNSREALQTWRRRADGASAAVESEAAPAGMADKLKAQLQALLEWVGRMNQPSNVEEVRATRRQLINAGYRSGKAPVFFTRRQALVGHRHRVLIGHDSRKVTGLPECFNTHILLCPGCRLWLLCSSALVTEGHWFSQGCASAGHSRCLGFDGGLCRSRVGIGSGYRSSR